MPYLEANQSKFDHLESGDGPVALFVHGFPFDATMWSEQLDGLAAVADAVATDVVESLERAPIGDRSSRLKRSHFPVLAASRRAARATAPQMTFADTAGIVPYLRSDFSRSCRLRRRAARATAPQMTFADTAGIVPYLRSL